MITEHNVTLRGRDRVAVARRPAYNSSNVLEISTCGVSPQEVVLSIDAFDEGDLSVPPEGWESLRYEGPFQRNHRREYEEPRTVLFVGRRSRPLPDTEVLLVPSVSSKRVVKGVLLKLREQHSHFSHQELHEITSCGVSEPESPSAGEGAPL